MNLIARMDSYSFPFINRRLAPKSGFRCCSTILCLIMVVLLQAGCRSGPPPKLYLLEVPATTSDIDNHESEIIGSIGLASVTLPDYASDDRIASLTADGSVSQNDQHRWAEDPEDAMTRLLSARLRYHSGGTVLIEPWPRDYKPKARVEVIFDRLLRQTTGGAELTGQIHLLSGDGRRLLDALQFAFKYRGGSTEYVAYFDALAQGLDEISRLVIDTLFVMQKASS
ncbi:MAG: PqiC family protein [Granulosicoccus sp.]|nr:PqiC family protein [Granulosicoccus sp.]